MATNKNITMRQFNGSDYDTLYPRTTPSQVSGLYDSVYTKDQVNSLFNQCVLLDGSRAMTGNLNMNNHYIPNVLTGSSGGDAVRKDYVDNLIVSCAKIQTGSYVGTGTYGPSNPVTLTFNAPPKIVFIFLSDLNHDYTLYYARTAAYNVSTNIIWVEGFTDCRIHYGGSYENYGTLGVNGNTFQFASTHDPWFNISGVTYKYTVVL